MKESNASASLESGGLVWSEWSIVDLSQGTLVKGQRADSPTSLFRLCRIKYFEFFFRLLIIFTSEISKVLKLQFNRVTYFPALVAILAPVQEETNFTHRQ